MSKQRPSKKIVQDEDKDIKDTIKKLHESENVGDAHINASTKPWYDYHTEEANLNSFNDIV